ncbi:hypothetical protein C8J57DRAFT_760516 [Mycena rebaudengoi]|nr:hypothetical protein C8J57DRAFT_760516 [Mycena rebaudengoi]
MEMFPLLLQLALLLFSAALSVYLSTISHPISSIVITLTFIGALAYISLLVSAAVYPDSPFQTPQMTPYLYVLEHIWGVKYTGTYQFTKDSDKTLAWTLIALSIVWEGFDFSGQQTLQDFYPLIRSTISTALELHNPYQHSSLIGVLIPPNFRSTFSTGLGDALIQAAKKVEDMIPAYSTQMDNQLDLNGSLQENTHAFHRAATILDEMGQALKLESEGEQVDCGIEEAWKYWYILRTYFTQQVDRLEKSLKETPGTAEISD